MFKPLLLLTYRILLKQVVKVKPLSYYFYLEIEGENPELNWGTNLQDEMTLNSQDS